MSIMKKITRLRKNRDFDYNPRYYDDKGKGNPYKIEYKFDQFRTTVDNPRGIKGKFKNAMADIRREGDHNMRIRMIVIIAVLVLIFFYIIDFDLSIFFGK